VERFVDLFYDGMKRDEDINKTFSKFGNFERLKSRTVDYLVGEWGGTPYVGQDLFAAHTQVSISTKNYDFMMKCIGESLKVMKITGALRQEVIDSIEAMREPITDPDEKFKKWAMEKLARLEKEAKEKEGDMVTTAMGFTITKAKYEQQQKELAEREERARKLNEMRLKREKEGNKKKEKDSGNLSANPSPDPSPRDGEDERRKKLATAEVKKPKAAPKAPALTAATEAKQSSKEETTTVMPCAELLTDLRPTLPGPDLGVEVRVRLAL